MASQAYLDKCGVPRALPTYSGKEPFTITCQGISAVLCCAGYMPCSGRCGESKCPEFCSALEVFLCFGNSVASTLFLLQDEFNIQTTKCDMASHALKVIPSD